MKKGNITENIVDFNLANRPIVRRSQLDLPVSEELALAIKDLIHQMRDVGPLKSS